MLTYGIYAVIVAALLVLVPMAVMEWWDLRERWLARKTTAEKSLAELLYGQSPGTDEGFLARERARMAALCTQGRQKEGD